MEKYKALLVIALVILTSIFFLFYRMYHNDVKALADFSTSYENFDTAILNFSTSGTNDLEIRADNALLELTNVASFRISSLIKNDKTLMDTALEVTNLSGKELDALSAYKKAIQNKATGVDTLAKEYVDAVNKRKTAYAAFEDLLK